MKQKTPFDTTDLEKEKMRCETIMKNYKGFCGTPIAEDGEYQDGFRDTHLIPKKWIKKIIELKEK